MSTSEDTGAPPLTGELETPSLVAGTALLGPYRDSAYADPRYLVRRSDGRLLLVPGTLYAIIAHVDGSLGVEAIADAVSAELGRALDPDTLATVISTRLRPLGVVAGGSDQPLTAPRPILSVGLQKTVLPPTVVRVLGRLLAPLFAPLLLVPLVLAYVGVTAWFFVTQHLAQASLSLAGSPSLIAELFGLYVLSGLFHELGHAAATVRGGALPGRIGFGVYVIIPAWFTDVSDTYRLGRGGRLRTDFGGVYFDAIALIVVALLQATTPRPLLVVLFFVVQIALYEQLLPFVRLDGYFVLSDLIGVPDLFGQARVGSRKGAHAVGSAGRNRYALRPKARITVAIWGGVVFPALTLLIGLVLYRLPALARASVITARSEWNGMVHAASHAEVASVLVGATALVLLYLPFAGIAVVALRTAASIGRRFASRLGGGTGMAHTK